MSFLHCSLCVTTLNWDTLQQYGDALGAIGNAQSYSYERASNRKLVISMLEQKLEEYNKSETLSDADLNMMGRTQKDYEQLIEEKTQGIIFRSKANWHTLSGKPTKYFLFKLREIEICIKKYDENHH